MPQIGLAIPTAVPRPRPELAVEFGKRAEAAGAHSVWILDRLVLYNLEPLVTLAAVAGATQRVRLGTSVLLGTLRGPALLAKSIASIDQISGGRFILGLGNGSRPDDFAAGEVPFEHRGGRAEELAKLLRLIWSGEPLKYEGKFYQFDVGSIGPRPVQPGGPPIWFGGSSEPALRRAGRVADGYISGSSTGPRGFRETWEKVRHYAETAGRDPSTLHAAALVYACVDDDRASATELMRQYLVNYYGPRRSEVGEGYLLGTPDACVRVAEEYFEAGVQTLIIGSATADPDRFDRLCQEVVPRLRER